MFLVFFFLSPLCKKVVRKHCSWTERITLKSRLHSSRLGVLIIPLWLGNNRMLRFCKSRMQRKAKDKTNKLTLCSRRQKTPGVVFFSETCLRGTKPWDNHVFRESFMWSKSIAGLIKVIFNVLDNFVMHSRRRFTSPHLRFSHHDSCKRMMSPAILAKNMTLMFVVF